MTHFVIILPSKTFKNSLSIDLQIRQLLGGSLKNRVVDDNSKEAVRLGFVLVFRCSF